jgi:hypothetical protein
MGLCAKAMAELSKVAQAREKRRILASWEDAAGQRCLQLACQSGEKPKFPENVPLFPLFRAGFSAGSNLAGAAQCKALQKMCSPDGQN